jgi:hypothetical protein
MAGMGDRMKYRTADDALRRYVQLHDDAAPRSPDPYELRGSVPLDLCPKGHPGPWRKQDGVEFCAASHCGAPRPTVPAAILRGTFQRGLARVRGLRVTLKPAGTGGAHAGIDEFVDLGRVWAAVPTYWDLICLYALVRHGSRDAARRWCRENWPRRIAGWSEHRFRSDVTSARQRAERRLAAMGLLQESAA